jgi:hypothetical protein
MRRGARRQLETLACALKAEPAAAVLEILASERVDPWFSDIVMAGESNGFGRTAISRWPRLNVLADLRLPRSEEQ